MNFVRFDNPLQTAIVSLFSFGLVYVFSAAINWIFAANPEGFKIQYISILVFALAFITVFSIPTRVSVSTLNRILRNQATPGSPYRMQPSQPAIFRI